MLSEVQQHTKEKKVESVGPMSVIKSQTSQEKKRITSVPKNDTEEGFY